MSTADESANEIVAAVLNLKRVLQKARVSTDDVVVQLRAYESLWRALRPAFGAVHPSPFAPPEGFRLFGIDFRSR